MRRSWCMSAMVVMSALVTAPAAAQANGSGPRSVHDSVYSAEQAERGEAVFTEVCGACHSTSQFRGDDFSMNWASRTLRDLYRLIRNTMPQDSPGRLSDQQYIDVVAYLLRLNRYPAGSTELASDEDALRRIRIEDPQGN